MPLQDYMQIISVDDYPIEDPRVFADRLAAKYLAEGPRIIEDEKGRHSTSGGCCYIEDDFGIKNRHEIGVDCICVEIDYPHSDSNWPNSRKGIAVPLAEVPGDEAHKIVELNAREVLNFPRS